MNNKTIDQMRDELMSIMLKSLRNINEYHYNLAERSMDMAQQWLKMMHATFPAETEETLRQIREQLKGRRD